MRRVAHALTLSRSTLSLKLADLQVEGLRALVALGDLELHLVPFAEILEDDLGGQARAVKEHIVAPVIGHDEAESFVPHDFLDRTEHGSLLCSEESFRKADRRPSRVDSVRSASGVGGSLARVSPTDKPTHAATKPSHHGTLSARR